MNSYTETTINDTIAGKNRLLLDIENKKKEIKKLAQNAALLELEIVKYYVNQGKPELAVINLGSALSLLKESV